MDDGAGRAVSGYQLSATEAAAAIRAGETSSEELVRDCLARIDQLEGTLGVWTYLDPAHALAQARVADQARRSGRPTPALHGVPVGINAQVMPRSSGPPSRPSGS